MIMLFMKNKIKTKSSAKRRFKITKSGKIIAYNTCKINVNNKKRIKRLLPYL